MIYKQSEGVTWLEFELLADCPVKHGSFLRHGGYSSGSWTSLNFGSNEEDLSENINANKEKVKKILDLSHLVSARLCHGNGIFSVNSSFSDVPIKDGLTIAIPNVGLLISQADCQAAIFYDPINHVLANVHCGWRGSVQNIYEKAISHLADMHGSKPENILVCISPSLGPEHAEFINYEQELPKAFWEFQVRPFYFDFWAISEWQLMQAGILGHHIQIARIDTFANPSDYFSYRRSKPCGRQATICALSTKK